MMTGRGGGSSRPVGSQSNSVTVDPDTDLCQNTSGEASVGGPLFAQFIIADAITGDCNGAEMTITNGNGYIRNVDGPQTEVYGRFEIDGQILNCTFIIDIVSGEMSASESSCTTDSGIAVSLSTSRVSQPIVTRLTPTVSISRALMLDTSSPVTRPPGRFIAQDPKMTSTTASN